MPLMHTGEFRGLEAEITLSDHSNQVTLQVDGDSHWATVTLRENYDVVAMRDWFVAYCVKANIGQ